MKVCRVYYLHSEPPAATFSLSIFIFICTLFYLSSLSTLYCNILFHFLSLYGWAAYYVTQDAHQVGLIFESGPKNGRNLNNYPPKKIYNLIGFTVLQLGVCFLEIRHLQLYANLKNNNFCQNVSKNTLILYFWALFQTKIR